MILKYFTMFILLVGLTAPTHLNNADKTTTKLDLLASYIRYTNPNNSVELCYHIASAIITEGGSDAITLASIAAVESDFTPNVVGDGKASTGMFQIQKRLWGDFKHDVYSQTRKARKVYLASGSIRSYNGSGSKAVRYERLVLRHREKIRRILIA